MIKKIKVTKIAKDCILVLGQFAVVLALTVNQGSFTIDVAIKFSFSPLVSASNKCFYFSIQPES